MNAKSQPTDDAEFLDYAQTLTIRVGRRFMLFLIASVVLWWPLDWLFASGDDYDVSEFAFVRLATIATLLCALKLLSWHRVRPILLTAIPAAHVAVMLVIGVGIGRMGGGELPWLTLSIIALVPGAMFLMPLRDRIAWTTAAALALPLACFLPFPDNERGPFWAPTISFLAFTTTLTIWMGNINYSILRSRYFQFLELTRARATLKTLNGSLEALVAARTAEIGRLASHAETLLETERGRISLELHDELGQDLTALRYTLSLAAKRVSPDPEVTRALLDDLAAVVERSTTTLRGIVGELRPLILDQGLFVATRWVCARVEKRSAIPCSFEAAGSDSGVPGEVTAAAFRIVQEATTNALKHASPTAIVVCATVDGATLTIDVRDDGRGFDPVTSHSGVGLIGMRERALAVGGTLSLESKAGQGTRLLARFDWSGGTP
ncbi:MAG: sensor histidine kinase [Myxococcales bacterium]|nr:sensor histidine kinase [Myxococcales bacterium]